MNSTMKIRIDPPILKTIKDLEKLPVNLRLNYLFCIGHSLLSVGLQDIKLINIYKHFLDQTVPTSLTSF